MKFTKMQATGNDFIIIDEREDKIEEEEKVLISRSLCRRKFSVGADGVLFVCKPTDRKCDIRMRVFNADGSEAEMSGNGIRCFSKYVYERMIVRKKRMKVETLGGIILPEVILEGTGARKNTITSVKGFMDKPVFHFINKDFYVNACIGWVKLSSLSLGNPHAVVIVDADVFENQDVDEIGGSIESHKAFPNRTNVNFVILIAQNEIKLRTYERGIGVTLSCGTGSTASVLALNKLGYINANEPVIVHTKGGDLVVEIKGEGAYLIGPAEEVYKGEIKLVI